MKRVKTKPKKQKHPSDRLSTENVIRYTQYLCIASTLMTLWAVYGVQEKEKAEEFIESYISFLQEKMDNRNTIGGVVEDCIKLTGFNPVELIDSVYEKAEKQKENLL